MSGPRAGAAAAERVELATRTLDRLGVNGDDPPDRARRPRARAGARGGGVRRRARHGVGRRRHDQRSRARARAARRWRLAGRRPGHHPGRLGQRARARAEDSVRSGARHRARAASARLASIDAGELGDHLFFNVAGIGLDAHVAALVSTRVHHRGLLPYLKASLGDLIRYPPVDYTIEIGGKTERTTALVLAFANSRQYGFGAQIAPAAEPRRRAARYGCRLKIADSSATCRAFRRSLCVAWTSDPAIARTQIRELTIRSRRRDAVSRRRGSGAGQRHARRARAPRRAPATGVARHTFARAVSIGTSVEPRLVSFSKHANEAIGRVGVRSRRHYGFGMGGRRPGSCNSRGRTAPPCTAGGSATGSRELRSHHVSRRRRRARGLAVRVESAAEGHPDLSPRHCRQPRERHWGDQEIHRTRDWM